MAEDSSGDTPVKSAPPRYALALPEKISFTFPHEVVEDPSLNETQKRTILAAWASDACAVEAFPALRRLPGTILPVTISAILDALRQLDRKYREYDEDMVQRSIVAQFAKRKSHNPSPRS